MIISYRWDVISKGEFFFACIGYYISNDCAQKVPIVLQVSQAEKNDPSMKKNNTKWHCRGHEPWISIDIQLHEFPNPCWQALHWPWLVAAGSKTITQIDMPSKSWKFMAAFVCKVWVYVQKQRVKSWSCICHTKRSQIQKTAWRKHRKHLLFATNSTLKNLNTSHYTVKLVTTSQRWLIHLKTFAHLIQVIPQMFGEASQSVFKGKEPIKTIHSSSVTTHLFPGQPKKQLTTFTLS